MQNLKPEQLAKGLVMQYICRGTPVDKIDDGILFCNGEKLMILEKFGWNTPEIIKAIKNEIVRMDGNFKILSRKND